MLPILNGATENTKKYIVSFRGLNMSEGYEEGEFSDTENVSSLKFPCLTQRFSRVEEAVYASPRELHTKEGLVVIDGTSVVYKGNVVGTVTDGRKQMAAVGNYVVIFPDKVYYNVETEEFGSMEAEWTGSGKLQDGTYVDEEAQANTIYAEGADWGSLFRVGDGVTISGCTTHEENNTTIIIREIDGDYLRFYENSFVIDDGGDTENLTIKREIPDLDFICESNYRLWGTMGNTIYGSKYSDPLNFQVFDGLTGDSYYIDVGSDGEFTGCIPYSAHICFFKENMLHKLFGSKPSNYQLVNSQVYGVQAGSERSMCIINEMLLYKGVHGVYAYTGGVPELISDGFGTKRFSEACGATDGERYYISMRSGEEWGLYVYDVKRGLWLREDGTHCVDMAAHDGAVYLLTEDGSLYRVDREANRGELAWRATFCPFNEVYNERKIYSKFHLRLELGAGASLKVEIRRDNGENWQQIYATETERPRTLTIPVIPERCDCVEIRLSGTGECLLRTFIREMQFGSDV